MKIENYKYNSFHIANTILAIANNNNIKTDLLKLMKLSYITVGYCLYFDFDPFIEDIQAWKLGPVIPSLWHEFKDFSLSNPITRLANDMNSEGKIFTPIIDENEKSNIDELVYKIIILVMNKYLNKNSWVLVDKTHQELTPWQEYEKRVNKGERNIIIPKEKIKKYYKNFLKDEFKD